MSVLRSIERKIAGLVEGTFSRAFRSEVRPVEIARKLAREMDEHRTVALRATYVPNEYRVYLSPRDRERFADYEEELISELVGYLLEHARSERLVLAATPVVQFETDDRLGLGEFGIETRVNREPDPVGGPDAAYDRARDAGYDDPGWRDAARQPGRRREPLEPAWGGEREPAWGGEREPAWGGEPQPAPGGEEYEPGWGEPEPDLGGAPLPRAVPAPLPRWEQAVAGRTIVHGAAERTVPASREAAGARGPGALLLIGGRRIAIGPAGVLIGRSRQCDVVLDDPNVSRSHAEIRPRGGSWVLRDLGSTNGTRLNGRRVDGPEVLRRGDEMQLGATRLVFELE
ncbi:MAG TPA: FhaA domain-containing protein [Solirubrobacteraceae bacterium]|nr:FhaA domain-containing protein [Solirubrobacteraceae bacterium]